MDDQPHPAPDRRFRLAAQQPVRVAVPVPAGFALDESAAHAAFSKIKDFSPGEDVIALVADLPGIAPGPLGKAYFHKGKGAETADHHVIYDKRSGKIFFDADGTGGDAQWKFAKVAPGTKLHADDFLIVPSSFGSS